MSKSGRKARKEAARVREWLFVRLTPPNPNSSEPPKPSCALCGYSDIRALEIDHIHGGGYKAKKGTNYLTYLRKLKLEYLRSVVAKKEEFRLLCSCCNKIAYLERIADRRRGKDRSRKSCIVRIDSKNPPPVPATISADGS